MFKLDDLEEVASHTIKINPLDKSIVPWVDKYRPKRINSLLHQKEIVKFLNSTLETGDLPNLIFYGPPGTGKTSAILALCYELFGPKLINERVLELNASDERGIDVVRDKIIKFAKTSIGSKDPNYPSPPYKIIILDEADAITLDAQSALRKVIESSSHITRFCFTCNYIEKIIQPIISRCVKFRFKPIEHKLLVHRLAQIAEKEQLNLNKKFIEKITIISEGDARRAIMILQNLKFIIKIKNKTKDKLTLLNLNEMVGIPSDEELDKIWNDIIFKGIDNIKNLISFIKKLSLNTQDILTFLHHKIINYDISDDIKSQILLEISNVENKILDRCDEELQMIYIFSFIYINTQLKN